ncbi:hypothetical protein L286_14990 [Sphingobium sp. HDIP04]|nr:hypothetical protein L286_14990 [Sphingobium sp. HDIP04]
MAPRSTGVFSRVPVNAGHGRDLNQPVSCDKRPSVHAEYVGSHISAERIF